MKLVFLWTFYWLVKKNKFYSCSSCRKSWKLENEKYKFYKIVFSLRIILYSNECTVTSYFTIWKLIKFSKFCTEENMFCWERNKCCVIKCQAQNLWVELKEVSISNSSEMNRLKNSRDGCYILHLFSQFLLLVKRGLRMKFMVYGLYTKGI